MITPVSARQFIEDETQWRAAPALSVEEVDRLLAYAQTVDSGGLSPGDVGYVETYTTPSLIDAVSAGWRWKRGKVAGQANIRAGDVALDRDHVYEQLGQQAALARSAAVSGAVCSAGGIGVVTISTFPTGWPGGPS